MLPGLQFAIPRGNLSTMKPPEWRPVAGFSGYEIDYCGRVRSWHRRGHREPLADTPHLLKPLANRRGYLQYNLHGKTKLAHRLVALAFIPNPSNLPEVAHENGDGLENYVGNLRWSTHRDNQMDMRRHGTMQDG